MSTYEKEKVMRLLWEEPIALPKMAGFTKLTKLHNDWLRSFLYYKGDQTIQGHRGSYKTTVISAFLALHVIMAPTETAIFFRKTSGDTEEVLRQACNFLSHPCMREVIRILYGKELDFLVRTKNRVQTNLGRTARGAEQIIGLGIDTSITGKHADVIITDDIVNVFDRTSRAEREKTKRAYQEMENIKNRGGRFINSGTPWHKEDAFTLMPNIHKFDCYHTGLIPKEEIEALRSKMLPSLFACNYELKHIASEDIIFTRPVTNGDAAMLLNSNYCHIDAAYGGADYTAFTICNKKDGKYYVFGKLWRRHVDDCTREIIACREKFLAGKIYVETNGDKGYLAKALRKKGERVVEYTEKTNKFLKITSYLKDVWNNVVFVEGTDETYINQITDYNENAEHDDAPDSLASIVRVLWGRNEGNRTSPFL